MNCGCKTYVPSSCCTPTNPYEVGTVFYVQNSWNIPACDETATLDIPTVKTLMVGGYLFNPTYGAFKITSFNPVTGKALITNECLYGNADAGGVVPANTVFFQTAYIGDQAYDWTPVLSSGDTFGDLDISDVVIDTAYYVENTNSRLVQFEATGSFIANGADNDIFYIATPVPAEDLARGGLFYFQLYSGGDFVGSRWRIEDDKFVLTKADAALIVGAGEQYRFGIQGHFLKAL